MHAGPITVPFTYRKNDPKYGSSWPTYKCKQLKQTTTRNKYEYTNTFYKEHRNIK